MAHWLLGSLLMMQYLLRAHLCQVFRNQIVKVITCQITRLLAVSNYMQMNCLLREGERKEREERTENIRTGLVGD